MLAYELPAERVAPASAWDLPGRVAAAVALAALAPALLLILVAGRRRGTRLTWLPRIGKHGRPFLEASLAPGELGGLGRLGVRRWPALVNVMRGDLALVGPRARAPGELDARDPRARALAAARPGLVGPWWIRARRGLDYGDELECDLAYLASRDARTDAGMLVRAALALAFGAPADAGTRQCRVLGVRADTLSMEEAEDRLAALAGGAHPTQVCFANADCLNLACRDEKYRDTLAQARLVLPDGVGIRIASRLAGTPIRHNVNGTDLFPRLCARLATDRRRVFLLGARPGIPEKVAAWIHAHHPDLAVAGIQHGYFTEEAAVIERIRASGADVLLVAFGAPRQDVWIRDHLSTLGVSLAIGVGGLFDFYSFTLPRAPLWVREIGMEWAFRLAQEPGRLWRRYVIGNGVFLARVALELAGLVAYGEEATEGAALA